MKSLAIIIVLIAGSFQFASHHRHENHILKTKNIRIADQVSSNY